MTPDSRSMSAEKDERFETVRVDLTYNHRDSFGHEDALEALASIKAELAEKDALLAEVTERMRVVRPAAERLRRGLDATRKELAQRDHDDELWKVQYQDDLARSELENRQLRRDLQEARELLDRLWDTANLTTVPADVLSRLRALQRTASNQEGPDEETEVRRVIATPLEPEDWGPSNQEGA